MQEIAFGRAAAEKIRREKQVNEIYSIEARCFKNWNSFAGISSDSYAVSLGSEGAFTGAVNYLGYPTFFRENYIHKIYGSTPSQFQLRTVRAAGVQSGCGDSIADVSGTLFYKSRDGSLRIRRFRAVSGFAKARQLDKMQLCRRGGARTKILYFNEVQRRISRTLCL